MQQVQKVENRFYFKETQQVLSIKEIKTQLHLEMVGKEDIYNAEKKGMTKENKEVR